MNPSSAVIELKCSRWVLEVKIPLIFSKGELIFNTNLIFFKHRPTVSFEVVNGICFSFKSSIYIISTIFK